MSAVSPSNLDGHHVQSDEIRKPLTSPCSGLFQRTNIESRNIKTSASLKERIKLNQQLTTSNKTGQLIGVKPHSKNVGSDRFDVGNAQLESMLVDKEAAKSSKLQNKIDSLRYAGAQTHRSLP